MRAVFTCVRSRHYQKTLESEDTTMTQSVDERALVTYDLHQQVARITVNNPPVNALSWDVRTAVKRAIDRAETDSTVMAIVLICEGRTFFAGADIREFAKPPQDPRLVDLIQSIEGCIKPVIAAIHGTALGGGLEVALGCHFRVADKNARFGLPEVKLGLLPGAGGTQRLPRLVGLEAALEMVVEGNTISAQKALEIGLVDELTDGDLGASAQALAARVIDEDLSSRRAGKLPAPPMNAKLFSDIERRVLSSRRGFEAPLRCIDAVRAALELPFEDGMATERGLFAALKSSPQSKALRHVFLAEREAGKLPFEAEVRSVRQVAVIGAGTMGGGIAMCFADNGIPVLLMEKSSEGLSKGLTRIRENYERSMHKGRLSAVGVEERMALISGTTQFEDLGDVDLVVEAVFEDLAVKHEVFYELDRCCKPGAILASNTSYLKIDDIAAVTLRPQDVVGMHFFSPANVMRLLENVRGSRTSPEVCASVMALGRRLGKASVLVGSCDGFVGNRMLSKRSRESYFLLQEGASPYDIDRVLRDFGFPMGPFAVADLAGLDIGWRNRQAHFAKLTPREQDCDVLDRMVASGRLGQKTGAGFYDYDHERKSSPSTQVEIIISSHRDKLGLRQRDISDQEILERCLYAMINEAAYLLEEGIVSRASDIDVVWLNGYGFPAYRGGPLCYADQIGLDNVVRALLKYEAIHGSAYWKPARLLVDLAESGRGFHDGSR